MLYLKRSLWRHRTVLFILIVFLSMLLPSLLPVKASIQEGSLPSTTPAIAPPPNLAIPDEFRGKIIRKVSLISDRQVIALTFDDGPTANITPKVLDILKERKIKATFFVIGNHLKNFPELAQRLVAEGHAIGNHTWHHLRRLMNEFTATREIEDTATLIERTTDIKTRLFRPPHGFLYNGLVDYAQKRKDAIILWSIDSDDWRGSKVSADYIVDKVLANVNPGAIILMHDGGGNRANTIKALPKIIDSLNQLGYEFVTIPQLLQMGSGK
ncbi:MAG TPA: polysaccharide deacetylase family protein [Cyanobacteria bacterium UBA11149]|nr:polysaccharide deacetylase family protein [Cyanobacteria bacterium UBA11367]HBE60982.1 polysaccharide deacetylase family protein [Cyanobacteria bacterium UBA11366]HBK65878.1 polysaccharide deacetylase family protein [Cyanobacteria bacterium UBA11166]HBR72450.1 polysaccharide deacetylase family protein [Cyanobacteria bacterium UBA11159]HBS69397.1 polysaccharide deacetylase family protein [Cyanobacteria bacterium UBA11153]HBW90295.1 polysaccharide deacetylase family protein [Cyanobacteria bac